MLICLEDIARVYRKHTVEIVALRQVNLDVAEGEFVAIMGPSGSGKSTLLHILGCLDRPSRGRYFLDDIDVSQLNDTQLATIRNQKIGFIFQAFNLLPQHTVLQNIEAPLLYSRQLAVGSWQSAVGSRQSAVGSRQSAVGSPQSAVGSWQSAVGSRQSAARFVAEQVGLGNRLQHRPSELSGGEMQRVAIARALVTTPRVIFADEPTGNLDSQTGQEIMKLLRNLHEQGHTIIVVTHESTVAEYAERIIFLKDGAIETVGSRQNAAGRMQSAVRSRQNAVGSRQSAVGSRQNAVGCRRLPAANCQLPTANCILPTADCLLRTAFQGVLIHKLRSLLSVLGIVFGIGAIIAMLAIGAGAKQEILEQIALLGMTNITIRAVPLAEESINTGKEQLSEGLTYDDAERIAKGAPYIVSLAAVRDFPAPISSQHQTMQARVVGTTPDYLSAANLSIRQGRFLTAADEQEMQRVCVLGAEVQQTLFAFQSPLGTMVNIRNEWFRVIGTLDNKALNPEKIPTLRMHNINTDVYIPLSTSTMFIPARESQQIAEISIRVDTPEHVDQVARFIRTLLTRVHYGAADYDVIVPRELLQQSQQTQNVFNLVMGSIAGISLLVGGIGIMNIMLATIAERTREIGIRRAIGASRRIILLQFLVETLLLTFVGGCLGILLGIGGAFAISLYAQWRTIISVQTIVLAFSISACIGIVFGLYPASQGANMDPIEALRYE